MEFPNLRRQMWIYKIKLVVMGIVIGVIIAGVPAYYIYSSLPEC